jgi:hypothetical protein
VDKISDVNIRQRNAGTRPVKRQERRLRIEWDLGSKVPVSQRVNSSRAPNDDPTLIEPIALAA